MTMEGWDFVSIECGWGRRFRSHGWLWCLVDGDLVDGDLVAV